MAVERRPIGKYLKRFRDAFHLKQKEVAEKIDVHPQLYLKYENDSSAPSVNVISSIAQAFNVTTDYLLGLSDEPRPVKYEFDTETINLMKSLQAWKAGTSAQ